jgi:hypothetical protein
MLLAYLLAVSAATGTFLTVVYLSGSDLLGSPTRSEIFSTFVITVVWVGAAFFSLLPVLVALVFAELCQTQSVRYFLIWGVVAASGVWFLFAIVPLFDSVRPGLSLLSDSAAFAIAGLTWGFVYWAIAGRTSGGALSTSQLPR